MTQPDKQLLTKSPLSYLAIAFILACALALAGCGGGGGGGSAGMDTGMMPGTGDGTGMMPGTGDGGGGGMTGGSTYTPPPRMRMLDASIPDAIVDTVIDELANDFRRAARNLPSFGTRGGIGHITKSSNNNHPDFQTLDRYVFDAEYDGNGQLQFSRTRRTQTTSFTARTTDSVVTFNRLNGSPAQGWQGVETQADYSAAIFYWDAVTDRTGAGDSDYLTLGYWALYLKDTNTGELTGGTSLGISANGSDPFTASNLAGLTGTATYEGPATGVLKTDTSDIFHYFTAKATLEANFGDGSALGTISGSITEARVEEGDPLNSDLTLGAADITNTFSGGNFRGDTSGMTSEGEPVSGSWGGKFFGNGASATDQPGSVAGTFGATTADGVKSLVGAFGAYKQ